jgi:hypothetical protein
VSRPWPSRRQRGRVWRGEAKAEVRAELDWRVRKCVRGRSAGGGGRPTRMASQQVERAAELHLVRARVAHRGCGQARRPCK